MVLTKNHNERCKDCKERVKQLLEAIFGKVEVNYDLNLPARLQDYSNTNIYADIALIYSKLKNHRGFNNFVKAKKLPRVDYFIPEKNLIVEFDESQHFTKPREITLNYYPKDKEYGYSIQKWHALCEMLNKRDNDPPYRDEQRAWYDTLRDFAPLLWKRGKTIRLYSCDLVWCSLDPNNKSDIEKFKKLICNNNGNMTKKCNTSTISAKCEFKDISSLNLKKIGIVSRDYRHRFPNKHRDFSYALPSILKLLDENGCDSVLFSLFSIVPRQGYNPKKYFKNLKNIKTVFLEEFMDGESRKAGHYVVYYRTLSGWEEYSFSQVFGSVTGMPKRKIDDFVKYEIPKRVLGNCCVLLCGETNGVKYSKSDKKIHDTFELRKSIPKDVNVILNPIHDRMTRFEMKLKRKFLSENDRYVISVWNKGKQDKNGKVRDGQGPAWTIYYNGKEIDVKRMQNNFDIEIGILDSIKA